MKRRQFLGAAGLAAIPRFGHAQALPAHAFPERPVRFVVPYAPGGSTDTSSRIVAERLSVLFGQQVIVDNKPGGGTIIGTEIVARAKPDGHTILLTPGGARRERGVRHQPAVRFHQGPGAGRPIRRPAAPAGGQQRGAVQVGGRASGRAEERRPTIPYASAGIGSIPHLWGEYLKARTGLPLEHVGYKGSAEALRDVMAGHVPLFSDVLMPTAAPVRAGKLRGLAVAMAARSALLPDVPTVGEAGLAGMEGAVPFGISTTGGTPADLVERLNAAVNEALGDEGVRRKLQELGFIPIGGTAAFYAQSLVEETAKWRKVIEESKIPAPA